MEFFVPDYGILVDLLFGLVLRRLVRDGFLIMRKNLQRNLILIIYVLVMWICVGWKTY